MSVKQLKPVLDWDEKEVAQAPYDLVHLQGPQLTSYHLSTFRFLSENPLTKELLYYIYMAKNHMPQVSHGSRFWARQFASGAAAGRSSGKCVCSPARLASNEAGCTGVGKKMHSMGLAMVAPHFESSGLAGWVGGSRLIPQHLCCCFPSSFPPAAADRDRYP